MLGLGATHVGLIFCHFAGLVLDIWALGCDLCLIVFCTCSGDISGSPAQGCDLFVVDVSVGFASGEGICCPRFRIVSHRLQARFGACLASVGAISVMVSVVVC